ncbi:MAG: ABC transporter substrate-binding protein [Hominisplanchenecus sp.]
MKRKWISMLCCCAMAVTMLAGCGNGQKEASGTEALGQSEEVSNAATGREARKQADQIIVAIGEEPETGFDPSTGGHGSITKVFFSTLFKRDKQLGWSNDLATGYQVSKDKLTWTVTIRDDAVFTNGEKVTAEDVAFTYATAKESGSDIDLTMIEDIQAVDEVTVAFKLNRVYSPFIERLAYLGIVPKDAYDESFKDCPIGSGPYKFVQWDKGQQVIAVANEDYYGEIPKMKQLTMVFMDKDAAFTAVANGDVDVASINGILAQQEVPGTYVENIDSIECYGVCFPMQPAEGKQAQDGAEIGNNVTCDLAVRQAFNKAVDREKIVSGVLNGYGTVSTTGLEKMPWLNEDTVLDPSEYGDIEGAKKILADAGWADTNKDGTIDKDGVEGKFKLLYTDGVYRQEMALEFVNVAKELGMEVTLEKVTWDTIIDQIHKEAVFFGFGSGDPSELFNLYYGPNAGGAVSWDNAGCYANPDADAEIDEALNSMDEEEALEHWKNVQNYASARGDAPYCWLVNANHVYLCAEGFSFGQPVVQPHGGRIFDNVNEWAWE